MPKRLCIEARRGCSDNGIAVEGTSRCRAHTSGAWTRKRPGAQVAYADPLYRRNRALLLKDHPPCSVPGCRLTADTVDHIVPPHLGGSNELENLRPMCRRHNEARGAAAGRATQKRRAARRRQQ